MERKTSSEKLDEGQSGTAATRDGKDLPGCSSLLLWPHTVLGASDLTPMSHPLPAENDCAKRVSRPGCPQSCGAASPERSLQHADSEAAASMLLRTTQGKRKARDRVRR